MGQINGGLDQIDQVTQANTASAEESASAAEELNGQAQQLKIMVSRFQLSSEGPSSRPSPAGSPDFRRSKPTTATKKSLSKPSTARVFSPPSGSKPDILLNDDFDTF
jgi:methyl-accepting chemotaxis protein